RLLKNNANDFGRSVPGRIRVEKRREVIQLGWPDRVRIVLRQVQQKIRRLRLQFFVDLRKRFAVGPTRIEEGNGPTAAKFHGVPAKKLHQDFARLGRRRPREKRCYDLLERPRVGAGDDKARRALLQKQFLERRQLVQDRPVNRLWQFAEEPFESLDDVEQARAVHSNFGFSI